MIGNGCCCCCDKSGPALFANSIVLCDADERRLGPEGEAALASAELIPLGSCGPDDAGALPGRGAAQCLLGRRVSERGHRAASAYCRTASGPTALSSSNSDSDLTSIVPLKPSELTEMLPHFSAARTTMSIQWRERRKL